MRLGIELNRDVVSGMFGSYENMYWSARYILQGVTPWGAEAIWASCDAPHVISYTVQWVADGAKGTASIAS